MKIICPDHKGLIYVDENIVDQKSIAIKQVVDCPVCDEEVLIEGVFDFDEEGLAEPV